MSRRLVQRGTGDAARLGYARGGSLHEVMRTTSTRLIVLRHVRSPGVLTRRSAKRAALQLIDGRPRLTSRYKLAIAPEMQQREWLWRANIASSVCLNHERKCAEETNADYRKT